jgi:hypothetical protein
MRDQALTSSLDVQNPVVSNVVNVPSFCSFNWRNDGRDCAVNISVDNLLQKLRCRSILPYRVDVEKLTRRCD